MSELKYDKQGAEDCKKDILEACKLLEQAKEKISAIEVPQDFERFYKRVEVETLDEIDKEFVSCQNKINIYEEEQDKANTKNIENIDELNTNGEAISLTVNVLDDAAYINVSKKKSSKKKKKVKKKKVSKKKSTKSRKKKKIYKGPIHRSKAKARKTLVRRKKSKKVSKTKTVKRSKKAKKYSRTKKKSKGKTKGKSKSKSKGKSKRKTNGKSKNRKIKNKPKKVKGKKYKGSKKSRLEALKKAEKNIKKLVKNLGKNLKAVGKVKNKKKKNKGNKVGQITSKKSIRSAKRLQKNVSKTKKKIKKGWKDLQKNGTKSKTWKRISKKGKRVLAGVGASAANTGIALVKGVGKVGEAGTDSIYIAGTAVNSLGIMIYGGLKKDKKSKKRAKTQINKMWKNTMSYVAKDHVESESKKFYKNTKAGRWLDKNAYKPFKSNSVAMKTVTAVGKAATMYGLTMGAGSILTLAGATVSTSVISSTLSTVVGFGSTTQAEWSRQKKITPKGKEWRTKSNRNKGIAIGAINAGVSVAMSYGTSKIKSNETLKETAVNKMKSSNVVGKLSEKFGKEAVKSGVKSSAKITHGAVTNMVDKPEKALFRTLAYGKSNSPHEFIQRYNELGGRKRIKTRCN